ncbi:hypothetical protein EB810_06200 [Altererythrobacter sp. FM1]|nr:hypothetical protein EB810_06200 [Altererythrobacter sp. FM1]
MAMGGSKFSRWRFGQTLFDEAGGTLVVDGQTVETDRNCGALLGHCGCRVNQNAWHRPCV